MHYISTVVSLVYIYLTLTTCTSEQVLTRTKLDSNRSLFRQSRLWLLDNIIGRTGIDPKIFDWNLKRGVCNLIFTKQLPKNNKTFVLFFRKFKNSSVRMTHFSAMKMVQEVEVQHPQHQFINFDLETSI